jgi:uncharacterized membrane protein YbhN (UPF0104 family)
VAGVVARLVRLLRSPLVRIGFVLLTIAALAWWVVDNWHDVRPALTRVSVLDLLLAFLPAFGALFAVVRAWQILLGDLGSRIRFRTAMRLLFLGQLGKYLPGSVWPVLAQMELGAEDDIPRKHSAVALLVQMGLGVVTGGMMAAVALPFGSDAASTYWWGLFAVPLAVVFHPRLINPIVRAGLRAMKVEPIERPLTARVLLEASGWLVLQWLLLGLHIYVLAHAVGGHGASLWPVALGGYALSWVCGFLVVIAPAGGGVRETVLAVVLGGLVPTGAGIAVALLSRMLLTAADVLAGLLALVLMGRRRIEGMRQRARELRSVPPPTGTAT